MFVQVKGIISSPKMLFLLIKDIPVISDLHSIDLFKTCPDATYYVVLLH